MRFERGDQEQDLGVDITPLIDIVFLMLIFFMVTTTFQKESELKVQLPRAETDVVPEEGEKIEVIVSSDGRFLVNGQALVNTLPETLRAALHQAANGNFSQPVVIRADRDATVQLMVTAVNSAAKVGLSKVAFATSQDQP